MLSERLLRLRDRVRARTHREQRLLAPPDVLAECEREGLSWVRRNARLVRRLCEAETVVLGPGERIFYTRTVPAVPPVYTDATWRELFRGRVQHELGPISNVCADWSLLLRDGLLGRRRVATSALERTGLEPAQVDFLESAVEAIDAVVALARRYAAEARRCGQAQAATRLERVPAHPARSFHEALQCLRFGHGITWLAGHYHVGLGRLDQYLWPYYRDDLAGGALTATEAEELLAEFFVCLNKDTDLYPGVQQGDNGQTVMLGGVDPNGHSAVNALTFAALRVARDLGLIDPKINLRVDRSTDPALLNLAAELTGRGLGFPQYSNDEVVIPALVAHGYDLADARDYTVAACWEFVIPGKGMEVVNLGAVSLPYAAHRGIVEGLTAGADFAAIRATCRDEIGRQVEAICQAGARLLLPPAPWYSAFFHDCLEAAQDLSAGARYNGFGIHGAGAAGAADALAAVRQLVFAEGRLGGPELLAALAADFVGYEDLRRLLQHEAPKVGNHDPDADDLLASVFADFAAACEQWSPNHRGGPIRPGTGAAMYYVWLATGHPDSRAPAVQATADGRRAGEYFSSSLAPSLHTVARGPLSVLQSFSHIDYRRVCNGGPITLELAESVFADDEGIGKVAGLVRLFAQLGCQQLQLNTLNVAALREAQRHPEQHRNLIVRVWGWSGYFCELAPEYQEHIIQRQMHQAD
jgi:formate C-acetyltransferase